MEINLKIEVKNSIENVWKALTEDEYVSQYMFDSKIDSNWSVGSHLNYYIEEEGNKIELVLGSIETINAPHSLQHTLFPAGADYPNIPSNHIFVRYTLQQLTGVTSLQIEQGRFDSAENGEQRYLSAKNGWEMILPQLKAVAEKIT